MDCHEIDLPEALARHKHRLIEPLAHDDKIMGFSEGALEISLHKSS